MGRAVIRLSLIAILAAACMAGNKRGPSGTIIVGGGYSDSEQSDLLLQRMIEQAGTKPNVIVIPTADARLEPAARPGAVITPIDYENDTRPDFISLGAGRIRALHTRNRLQADNADFLEPLRFANLVWIPNGDPQLLFNVYPKTRVERELKAVLDRGGVVAADSAGALLLGQIWFKVDLDHAASAAKAPEAGIGLLPAFVMPHANRYEPGVLETAVKAQVGARPDLLGLLIDENTAVVVHEDQIVGIVGKGRVGIVESATSVRWLQPHDRYDLRRRALIAPASATETTKAQ